MEKTCTCEGVEESAKKVYQRLIDAGSPKWLAEDTAEKILNGGWVNCKCKTLKGDES